MSKIKVKEFEVTAYKHPVEANSTSLAWKVFIKVRFTSEKPNEWGELRAFGGSWIRSIDRSVVKTGVRQEHTSQLVVPNLQYPLADVEEAHFPLTGEGIYRAIKYQKSLPQWKSSQKPSKFEKQDLRIGNDQDIEIFYRKPVPNIPRSYREDNTENVYERNGKGDWAIYDPFFDESSSDMHRLELTKKEKLKKSDEVWYHREIDFKNKWHIIGRDEPSYESSEIKYTQFIEYWHAGEFWIVEPGTVKILAKKYLFLRVSGKGDDRNYWAYCDDEPTFKYTAI